MKKHILLISLVILLSGCCIGGIKTADVKPSVSAINLNNSVGDGSIDFHFEFHCCLKGKAKSQVKQLEKTMMIAYNDYDAGLIDANKLKEKIANAENICQAIKSHWCDNVPAHDISRGYDLTTELNVVEIIDRGISKL